MTEKKRKRLRECQEDANTAKNRLMEIEDRLREAGLIRKANRLSTIIESLEIWQITE